MSVGSDAETAEVELQGDSLVRCGAPPEEEILVVVSGPGRCLTPRLLLRNPRPGGAGLPLSSFSQGHLFWSRAVYRKGRGTGRGQGRETELAGGAHGTR